MGSFPAASASDVRSTVSALGAGATVDCRSTMGSHPDLISQLQDQAAIAFSTTTTAVTVAGGTGSTVPGTGTDTTVAGGRTTTTVKGGSTSTTKAPASTTTTKALPQVLPNQACSPDGAKGQNKITGAGLTCQKACYGSKLVWSSGPCPTTPNPGTSGSTTTPTAPASTTTSSPSGTTGG